MANLMNLVSVRSVVLLALAVMVILAVQLVYVSEAKAMGTTVGVLYCAAYDKNTGTYSYSPSCHPY